MDSHRVGQNEVGASSAAMGSSGVTDEEASIALAAAMAAQRMAADGGTKGIAGIGDPAGFTAGAVRGVGGGVGAGVGGLVGRQPPVAPKPSAASSLLASRIEGVGKHKASGSSSHVGSGDGLQAPQEHPVPAFTRNRSVSAGAASPQDRPLKKSTPEGLGSTGKRTGRTSAVGERGASGRVRSPHEAIARLVDDGATPWQDKKASPGIGQDHASSSQSIASGSSYGVGVARGGGSVGADGSGRGGRAGGLAWFRFWSGGGSR